MAVESPDLKQLWTAIHGQEKTFPSKPEAVSDVLCDQCLRVVKGLSEHAPSFEAGSSGAARQTISSQHHADIRDLLRSSLAGCHLCSQLYSLIPAQRAEADATNLQTSQYEVGTYEVQLSFESASMATISVEIHSVISASETVYLIAQREQPLDAHEPLTSWNTCSRACLGVASSWLERCQNEHFQCRIGRHPDDYPKRLICIGIENGCASLKLVSSEAVVLGEQYTTLSHCWGQNPPLKLLQKNLDKFLVNIPLDLLPSTFIDAVLITAYLGFRYLWIDALCIVQDLKSDWQAEIARMDSIYRFSELTIAALHASDSSQGCFTDRNPLQHGVCRLGDGIPQWYIDVPEDMWNHYTPRSRSEKAPPLHTRAWVIQERALSPRTLYFGKNMIYWECIECVASEIDATFERVYEVANKMSMLNVQKQSRLHSTPSQNMALARQNVYSGGLKTALKLVTDLATYKAPFWQWEPYWARMIESYSACSLTFARDKWPAIAGLASYVEEMRGEKLAYGLWKDQLAHQLLWQCFGDTKRVQQNFPSWSWLSIDGEIGQMVIDHKSALLDSLEDTMTAWSDETDDKIVHIQAPAAQFSYTADGDSKMVFKVDAIEGVEILEGRWSADYEMGQPSDLWAVQAQTVKYHRHNGPEHRCYLGIIVKAAEDEADPWIRVGTYVWKMPAESEEKQYPKALGTMRSLRLA